MPEAGESSKKESEETSSSDNVESLISKLPDNEKLKWREKFIRLEYYKDISSTVLIIVKNFSKQAAFLISGIGSLIGGYFQIKKRFFIEKRELKALKENQLSFKHSIKNEELNSQIQQITKGIDKSDMIVFDSSFWMTATLFSVFIYFVIESIFKRRKK